MKTYSNKVSLLLFLFLLLSNAVFCQNNSDEDDRMKIRLGFTSPNNLHRQILVTVDSNSTPGVDFGYDAENFETNADDMYWMIENRQFLIQGTNVIDATTTLPLGLHTSTNGNIIMSIEELKNVPEDLEIGILDKQTNIYYDIKNTTALTIHLNAGEYLNRFELKFLNEDAVNTTPNDEEENEPVIGESIETDFENEVIAEEVKMELNYINKIKSISIKNIGEQNIKAVYVYSITGQLIKQFKNIKAVDQALIKTYNLDSGNYILLLTSNAGSMTKKVSVR
ncbi:T9SS type A sorting domain-containing protein [Lacinutrix sp. WUR7]|uniref:T9SS type A sorting domain-containing protein n=1 Tax=Lacinutrix sp. WUR7 TaxID=2653681 RepID=UPI00193DC622|nr:T9SS type A sorting domain-containing protein [Lacinutrix sp. WUR7]QRM89974.1 T9SS type A sorting domain-containing protein [Lacinutrix sp. WUR7]